MFRHKVNSMNKLLTFTVVLIIYVLQLVILLQHKQSREIIIVMLDQTSDGHRTCCIMLRKKITAIRGKVKTAARNPVIMTRRKPLFLVWFPPTRNPACFVKHAEFRERITGLLSFFNERARNTNHKKYSKFYTTNDMYY